MHASPLIQYPLYFSLFWYHTQDVVSFFICPTKESCYSSSSYRREKHKRRKPILVPYNSWQNVRNANTCTNVKLLPLRKESQVWLAVDRLDADQDDRPEAQQQDLSSSPRAGTFGYSILRQPLRWDVEQDPKFPIPDALEDSWNASPRANANEWDNPRTPHKVRNTFTSLISSDPSPKKSSVYPMDHPHHSLPQQPQSIDLFQRTFDTLDYDRVLSALQDECSTVPAREIVENSRDRYFEYSDRPHPNRQFSSHSNPILHHGGTLDLSKTGLTASTVEGVHMRYQAIQELQFILETKIEAPLDYTLKLKAKMEKKQRIGSTSSRAVGRSNRKTMSAPPLGGNTFDLQHVWDTIQKGNVCEGSQVMDVSATLDTFMDIADWCEALQTIDTLNQSHRNETMSTEEQNPSIYQNVSSIAGNVVRFQQLPTFGKFICVDPDLYDLLSNAIDDQTGQLSGITFPTIGQLRAQIRSLKLDILATVESLLLSPSVKSKLSLESGGALYSEVNGRIVIPVYDKFSNTVGIVHDVSRSGKTAYCEPTEIVGPTNELRRAEAELQREEAVIWRMLTTKIAEKEDEIKLSLRAVAHIDLTMARLRLGEKLRGVIPQVSDEGVIALTNTKHPVLLLREVENVVGNDISIGSNGNQGLVLTGPNSGGKTVILKLMGLCALMARDGIPLPADNARVDFFSPILADIGDLQSVGGDLSTFSGHMLVCREVLLQAKKNSLVLMDELGSGTDPRQGVAIAQALLEAIVETGARVGITTHYFELKQLAASDPRFSVAGMQFVKGKPTYKLLPGVIGESFALSVAERLKLPQSVINRATELLDSETRQMGDLLRDMESQKALLDQQIEDMKQKQKEANDLEEEMKKQKEKLDRILVNARKEEAAKFAQKLEEKERILEEILEKLKSDPSRKVVARSWEEIKYVKRDALNEAQSLSTLVRKSLQQATEETIESKLIPLSELRQKPDLNVGDTLIICKKGSFLGKQAKIINIGGNRVDVTVNGLTMSMKLNELAVSTLANGEVSVNRQEDAEKKISKLARKALLEESLVGDNQGYGKKRDNARERSAAEAMPQSQQGGSVSMRLKSNTVDVLGCTFQEAKQKCEDKFSQLMTQKNPVVFVLHGHGSQGVLRDKIRDWLQRDRQWVKKWRPADQSDGGDAFTMVELKKLQL